MVGARNLLRRIDSFLIFDFLKRYSNEKNRIGFIVPSVDTYNKVMASTRIRCYDVIKYLNQRKIFSELYKENKEYKLVIFQKAFGEKHIKSAQKLKEKGSIIIFDINVNYIEKKGDAVDYILEEQTLNVKRMLELSDTVIVASKYLLGIYSKYHKNTILIEESVPNNFFRRKKEHKERSPTKLLYVGYATKARELMLIEGVLKKLRDEYGITLLLLCEKDPMLDIIPYEFIRYDQRKLPKILLEGDIKIAPRDLSSSYNLGHTLTKIAYPMAVGLPVVASPVLSYEDKIAILCKDEDCWYKQLKALIESPEKRTKLGSLGREFVRENFTMEKIGKQYVELLNQYIEVENK